MYLRAWMRCECIQLSSCGSFSAAAARARWEHEAFGVQASHSLSQLCIASLSPQIP